MPRGAGGNFRWADTEAAQGSPRSAAREAEAGATAYRRAFRCRSSPLPDAWRNDAAEPDFTWGTEVAGQEVFVTATTPLSPVCFRRHIKVLVRAR